MDIENILKRTLRVVNGKLVDVQGDPVVLRGVSLFWSQWGYKYYQPKVIQWLVNDWKISIVRIPVAIEHDGYLDNPKKELAKLYSIIDAAISCGLYVIVDWHSHNLHIGEAKIFFDTVSKKYLRNPFIIYEVFNEPNADYKWDFDLIPYYEEVIPIIRNNSPNAIIIIGTENYCQGIEKVKDNPVGFDDILYSLHFYAGSHRKILRSKLENACKDNIPIFVSEYGVSEACGNGIFDPYETKRWWKTLDKYRISYVAWAISDKKETASLLYSSASPYGYWSVEDITPSGKLIRDKLLFENNKLIYCDPNKEINICRTLKSIFRQLRKIHL